MTETSWHSYPSVYALGHKALENLLDDAVIVEEKVDGSQFSFGVFDGEIRCRSKGQQLYLEAPEALFALAVEEVKALAPRLRDGWTYRGEYLQKPKHGGLKYARIPVHHVILFDINPAHEEYLSYDDKRAEADRIGLEVVPCMYSGRLNDAGGLDFFRSLLDRVSVLGDTTIEGVVVKNYARFGRDKKALMGKYVSERHKETIDAEFKKDNAHGRDILQQVGQALRTEARWQKAVQHLRERGLIEGSPRDIGVILKEVWPDIEKEERERIADKLYGWAAPTLRRMATAGLPEWYKQQLLEQQFEEAKP